MTKKFIQLLLLLLFIGSPAFAQFVGFEDAIPQNFKCANVKELALSTSFYKEGTKSLEWNFTPGSVIDVAREKPFNLRTRMALHSGYTTRNHRPIRCASSSIRLREACHISLDSICCLQVGALVG